VNGAVAAASSCLEENGFLIKEATATQLVVSTQDGSETAHIEAHANLDGDPYLTGGLDDETVPLGPSALRAAVDECLAPWEAMPPKSEDNLP
jgi:hypothetical protein